MTKARFLGVFFLSTFLMGCVVFLVCLFLTASVNKNIGFGQGLYDDVSDSLLTILDDSTGGELFREAGTGKRLSQQIAVITSDGVFSVSGTVTKVRDAFYPGTYDIHFSRDVILTSRAEVKVMMNVKAGEKVHVLIGDKDTGYTEFATVVASEDKKVSFYTNILQDYTLSTTDICAAQETVEDILSMHSLN